MTPVFQVFAVLVQLCVVLALVQPACAAPGDIFITFMARTTAPVTQQTLGHAFFCINLHLNNGEKEECFGFYPQSVMKALNGPGVISNEFKKAAIQNVSGSIDHKITESTRSAVYAEIQKWAGANYKLVLNNCGDFIYAVAAVAGLSRPDRSTLTLPTEFVQGLKDRYWTGSWGSSDAPTRFRLAITGTTVNWAEKNPESGLSITKTVMLDMKNDGSAILSRPNTPDVLQELGYNPALIPQIAAAGPKPSFLKVRREDRRIIGEWNGLIVIKDAKGNFKQLHQPGATPPKRYDFDRIP